MLSFSSKLRTFNFVTVLIRPLASGHQRCRTMLSRSHRWQIKCYNLYSAKGVNNSSLALYISVLSIFYDLRQASSRSIFDLFFPCIQPGMQFYFCLVQCLNKLQEFCNYVLHGINWLPFLPSTAS